MKSTLALTALVSFALASSAVAQDTRVRLVGTVLNATMASGPFAAVTPGDLATLTFDVETPGFPIAPGQFERYDIRRGLVFEVAGIAATLPDPPTQSFFFQNDFPVADGISIMTSPMAEPAHFLSLTLTNSTGLAFGSSNIEDEHAAYPGSVFDNGLLTILASGLVEVMIDQVEFFPAVPNSIGTSYCGPAMPNSTGAAAAIAAIGSPFASVNNVTLMVGQLPPGQFGFFLAGQTQGMFVPPGSSGTICLSGNIGRFNNTAQIFQGPIGELKIDLAAIPVNPAEAVAAGETWNFQAWYRDTGTSNFSDGLTVVFQ